MSDADYIQRQAARDRQHRQAMEDWIASMSPKERAEAQAAGILDDHGPSYEMHGGRCPHETKDPAESDLARTEAPEDHDGILERLQAECGLSANDAMRVFQFFAPILERESEILAANTVQKLAAALLSYRNVRAAAAGLAFAAELGALNGMASQSDWARQSGLSRASISKYTNRWRGELGLPPSAFQKSLESCEAYSLAQKTKHWRKQKFTKFHD